MNSLECSLKQEIGALLHDVPRLIRSLRNSPPHAWIFMRNRNERLLPDDQRIGVRCDWQWTSDLHIARVFPALGLRLMKRALSDRPIEMRSEPPERTGKVNVSFIIGHRGTARLPHLLATLQTIAAQRTVSFECIVVEQSTTPEINKMLPAWVRYVHTPLPAPDMPFCRSWAFNVGARQAVGALLIFHDNDLLIPASYADEAMKRHGEGYELINLKRFIFYLNETHTVRTMTLSQMSFDAAPLSIMQNAEAGGSLAVDRETFFAIGGFDEAFVGWGGEDNEFWERAQTRKLWPFTYLPLIHLWHAAQPEKPHLGRKTAALYEERSRIPVSARIRELCERDFGNPSHPDPQFKESA